MATPLLLESSPDDPDPAEPQALPAAAVTAVPADVAGTADLLGLGGIADVAATGRAASAAVALAAPHVPGPLPAMPPLTKVLLPTPSSPAPAASTVARASLTVAPARPRPRPRTDDRAPGELDRHHREALAVRIAAMLAAADRVPRGHTTPPERAARAQVVAAAGRLRDLEHVLRSGIPLSRCGERAVVRVLSGAATGAYGGRGTSALRDDARSACSAAGIVTAFR